MGDDVGGGEEGEGVGGGFFSVVDGRRGGEFFGVVV